MKITRDSADAQSADIVAGNIDQLRSLFPEAFTEGRIDFDVLKQLLGGNVDIDLESFCRKSNKVGFFNNAFCDGVLD